MKYKLYAFWKHDIPPYVLGGEVTEIKSNGRVCVKGFTGYSFLPLQILPLEEGRAKQKEIDLAFIITLTYGEMIKDVIIQIQQLLMM